MTTTATSPRAEPASSQLAAFDSLLGRPVSMRAMALLRVLVGPVVLLHLRPILDAARDGRIYRDAFYEPYASDLRRLPVHDEHAQQPGLSDGRARPARCHTL